MAQQYRKITMPTCPHCGVKQSSKVNNYNYGKLVNMATGYGSSDVVLHCDACGKAYRVTCNIRFYGSKKL